MKKNIAVIITCIILPALCAPAWAAKEKDEIIDESKMPIMEDKPTIEYIPAVDEATDRWVKKNAPGISGTLIKKYFKDNNTFVIICKGYPKEGARDLEVRGTAREAALINAQVIAKQSFSKRINVITGGSPEKYVDFEGFAVVYYVVKRPGLRSYAR